MAKENSFFKMDMLILLVLKEKDYYAYELASVLKEKTNGVIDMSLGTLYPILYRLQSDGHISGTDIVEGRRVKVYYHIEESGVELLDSLKEKYDEWIHAISLLMGE